MIPTALRLAVLTLIVVVPLTGLVATLGSSPTAVASSPVFASPFSAARNVAYDAVAKNVELEPSPPAFWNVMLTVIGSDKCDSMFAIATLIAASIAAALGSLVMDASNVGVICRPAETTCGAPSTGAPLSMGGRTPASEDGTPPGST